MVSGFKRALRRGVKLDTLNLDLKHWRELADSTILLSHRVLHIHLLYVKGTVNGCINVARASCNIDFDVTPPLFFRPDAFF